MSRRKKLKYSYDPSRDPFELAIDDRFRPSELPISPSKLEDLARLRELILTGEVQVDSICDESTLLAEVAQTGHLETVQTMLEAGANVNLPSENPDVTTALIGAATGGNLEIVELLVEHGADVNQIRGGTFALIVAGKEGHQDIFNYLAPLTNPKLIEKAFDWLTYYGSQVDLDILVDLA